MRQTVRAVARLFPTAIISGRGRDKVYSFVQLQELFYAGSHGLDIVGPVVSHKIRIHNLFPFLVCQVRCVLCYSGGILL